MWKKIVGYSLMSIVALAGAVVGWLYLRKPAQRPARNIHVAMTPERIARGRMVWTLADCDGCHSPHDVNTFAVLDHGKGQGNAIPDEQMGELDIPNITPDRETGIGTWTDGEKIRAIREGVDKDGRALFPMMPYDGFRNMSDDDVQALVAYLDTLPPVRHAVPKMKLPFPLALLIKGAPRPVDGPVPHPDKSNRRAWGQYVVAVGGCEGCHTPNPKLRFGGGNRFAVLGKVVYSANISPDPDTGIGAWTLPYFKQRIRAYKDSWPDKFTLMPWHNVAQLSDVDIEAIYYFLNEQKPVSNKVNPFREQKLAQLR